MVFFDILLHLKENGFVEGGTSDPGLWVGLTLSLAVPLSLSDKWADERLT